MKKIRDCIGKSVEIYVSSQCQHEMFVENGTVVAADCELDTGFVALDNGTIINIRYIVKIVVKG